MPDIITKISIMLKWHCSVSFPEWIEVRFSFEMTPDNFSSRPRKSVVVELFEDRIKHGGMEWWIFGFRRSFNWNGSCKVTFSKSLSFILSNSFKVYKVKVRLGQIILIPRSNWAPSSSWICLTSRIYETRLIK